MARCYADAFVSANDSIWSKPTKINKLFVVRIFCYTIYESSIVFTFLSDTIRGTAYIIWSCRKTSITQKKRYKVLIFNFFALHNEFFLNERSNCTKILPEIRALCLRSSIKLARKLDGLIGVIRARITKIIYFFGIHQFLKICWLKAWGYWGLYAFFNR